MKSLTKIILGIAFLVLTDAAVAQDTIVKKKKGPPAPSEGLYCAVFRDGRMVVMINDKIITTDIQLQNGHKITTTGSVIKKDGSRIVLKNGDCVNKEGNVVDEASLPANERKMNQ